MREISEIHFTMGAEAEPRAFIDRYVLDAVERLPETDACEYAAFMPLTHGTFDDVWITIAGDVDAVVDRESDEWDAFVEEGVVSEWEVSDTTDQWYDKAGEQGGELQLRLHRVANQATRAAFAEFDEPTAPIDAYPDETSKHPVGFWTMLHVLAGHQGYTPAETVGLFLAGLRKTCQDAAETGSADEAVRHIDQCVESLESIRDDIES